MKMLVRFLVLNVVTWSLWAQCAQAKEEKWTHYGVRPLGMGNAYVAVADDFNALFYNPAGLARLKDWTGEFLNPTVDISANTAGFIGDAQALADGSAGNTEAVIDLIEGQTGKVQHLGLGLTPHFVYPGWGFGVGLELAATMIFHRYPTIEMDVGPSVIVPISFAFNTLEDRLSLGFTVKSRIDGGIDHTFSLQDIEAFTTKKDVKVIEEGEVAEEEKQLTDFVQGGVGYGADVGLLFTPIKPMEPTIGLSITDVGGTSYKKSNIQGDAKTTPDPVLPSVNMGFSIKPYQTPASYVLLAADVHSINQPYSFSKKLNLGSEYGFSRIIKLQLGLHQGYLTAGMQFDVRFLKIRLATYAEEMGSTAGTLEDRRYVLQLKLLI